MKKFLMLLMVALLITSPVLADQSTLSVNGHSISGLSDAQIAKLQADAAALAESNQNRTPSQTLEEVSKYAELGKEIGTGLAATAKELGVAVNDFANSPIGKIATFIIVFKLVGTEIIGVVFGLLWFLAMVPVWLYMFRRVCLIKAKEIVTEINDKGRKSQTSRWVYFDRSVDMTEGMAWYRILMFILLGLICIAGFVMIF